MDGEKEPDVLDFGLLVLGLVALGVFIFSFQSVRDHFMDAPPYQLETEWPVAP